MKKTKEIEKIIKKYENELNELKDKIKKHKFKQKYLNKLFDTQAKLELYYSLFKSKNGKN